MCEHERIIASEAAGTGTLIVTTAYDARGYATTLTRASDGTVYGTVEAMDAWGHATMITEANGVTLTRGYAQATGLAINLQAANATATLAQYSYQWDGYGNLAERDDVLAGSEESESYDDLNRLTKSILTLAGGGGGTTTYAYDASGNRTEVCTDGDCVTYGYGAGAAGPHAVTANSDGDSFAYDADGEMTSDNGKSLAWAAFGQPTAISQGGTEVDLAYDGENARYEKSVTTDAGTETVLYLGAAEKLTVNGQDSIRRTLALADLSVIDTGGANAGLRFVATDHLGSTVALTQSNGGTQSMSYGPFGERMTAGWAGYMSISQALTINQTESDRGYTGQEGLDAVGLWDFNARLYDPALGRFLSVDPLIAHPESTQGINPYSYVENNPLNATDPTGMAESTTTCTGSGSNRTCTNTTPVTNVATGSRIPQTTTVTTTTVNGKVTNVSTSGGNALPGGRIASSMDGNSSFAISPNAAHGTNINDSTSLGNQPGNSPTLAPPSAAGASAAASLSTGDGGGGGLSSLPDFVAEGNRFLSGLLEGGGAYTSIAESFKVSGDMWKGANGKWYSIGWGGNGATGGRTAVLEAAGRLKLAGRGLFFAGAAIGGIRLGSDLYHGNYTGAAKSGLDIGMSAVGTFGGPIGLTVSGFYFLIDTTVGWGPALTAQADAWREYDEIMGRSIWAAPKQ